MHRPLRKTTWLLALLAMALAARESLAAEPLEAFPEQAAAVVRFASLDKFAGGFKEMAAGLGPLGLIAGPGLENGLNQMFEIAGNGQALDRTAPAYVAIFPLENQGNPVAWLVRTADEAKLRKAVLKAGAEETLAAEKSDDGFEKISKDGRDGYFGRHGDWTLYTLNENVAKLLASGRGQAKSFAALVEPRAKEMLEAGDGAIFVNAAMLTEKYGEKLTEARERAMRQIDSLPDEALGGGGTGSANPKAVKKMYGDLAGLAFDVLGDMRWFAGRANFTAAGVGLSGLLAVKQDSGADKFLAANPPAVLENLGLLPSGAMAYYGYQANYKKLLAWSSDFAQLAYGGDSSNVQKTKAAAELMLQAGLGPKVGSLSFAAGKGMVMTSLQQAEDPEKLGAAVGQSQSAVEAKTPTYSQTVEYQPNAETYQGKPVGLLTTRFEFLNVNDEGQKIGQKIMEKMFGGSQMQTRLTSVEGLSVQAMGNDPKYLHQAIDGLSSGEGVLGLDEAFAKTRDQLGEQANLVVLLNVPRLVVDAVGLVRDVPPFDMLLARAPFNFGAQPAVSYAGLSLATEAQAVRLRLFVPVEQPKGVLQIFGQ